MGLSSITDRLARGLGGVADAVTAPFSDKVVRLGVTGLSRAGKTVFITSLVANLMDRGRMPQLSAAARGAIQAAYLQPQPDDTVPRFPFEANLSRLTSPTPTWPEGTDRISELRLSIRVQPQGMLSGMTGPRTVHLDIVDYPGEWLLDLRLLDLDYATWSAQAIDRARERPGGAAFLAALSAVEAEAPLDEPRLADLAEAYAEHLALSRAAGFSDCTPGRFLMPGDLKGSPALTFAPLPPGPAPRGSLAREAARRYDAYRRQIVRPFFRDHFSKIDRQVVLVDVLGALHAGPAAVEDLRRTMAELLTAFRPGANAVLSRILHGRRVERILFAATKADHLHHKQHPQLTEITRALLRDARDRADFAGARTAALSIAALRTTVEDTVPHAGGPLDVVRGRLLDSGRLAAFHPGRLPDDPSQILGPARDGAEGWLEGDYGVMRFAPAPLTLRPGDGPPHIRLDKAAEFLIGDLL